MKKKFPVPPAAKPSSMAVSIKATASPEDGKTAKGSLDRASILAARAKNDTVLVSFRCDKEDLLKLRVLKRQHRDNGDPRTQDQLISAAVHAAVANVEIPEDPRDVI